MSDLSIRVVPGEYFALAGQNGAGKTTLIRIMLDLIRGIDQGSIQINGVDNKQTQSRKYIAYLPEKFELAHEITGWQYLKFVNSVYLHKLDQNRIAELCKSMMLDQARLSDKVSQYSKGMRQKLGLISCFMLDTEFIILDEPLSGLDPSARYLFKQLLSQERRKQRTIFYSTHMLADAEEICDRFGILHQGKIVFSGTPAECVKHYQVSTLEQAYMQCIREFDSD